MTETVNDTTAEAATDIEVLPLYSLQLIGLLTGAETPKALLRGSDGAILTAAQDEDTPMGRLKHIGTDFVLIDTGPELRRLTLPA